MRLAGLVNPLLLTLLAARAGAQVTPVRADGLRHVIVGTMKEPAPERIRPELTTRRNRLAELPDGPVFATLSIAAPMIAGRAYMDFHHPGEVRTWTHGDQQPYASFRADSVDQFSSLRLWAKVDAPTRFLVICRLWMSRTAQMRVATSIGTPQSFSFSQLIDGHLVFIAETAEAGWAQVAMAGTEPWNLYGCELRTMQAAPG